MRTNMRVAVVGQCARSHALYEAIKRSRHVSRVFCTRGNGGIPAEDRRFIDASSFDALARFAKEEQIDLIVPAGETPLIDGIVDYMLNARIRTFGPTAKAARLEGSKTFMKRLCATCGVPTANYRIAHDLTEATTTIKETGFLILKTDEPNGGKGTTVAKDEADACAVARRLFEQDGATEIVIEEALVGRECTVMKFVRGHETQGLQVVRDRKRAYDGDQGLNTGGMGSYTPVPDISPELLREIDGTIFRRIARGLIAHNILFTGIMNANLIVTSGGPKLLEINVRFGDPEWPALMPLVASDIVEYMLATFEPDALMRLGPIETHPGASVCTVLASGGYPGAYTTGYPISGLDVVDENVHVFHAGTRYENGTWYTDGGRVLDVVCVADTLSEANRRSQAAADAIDFRGKFNRTDIFRAGV